MLQASAFRYFGHFRRHRIHLVRSAILLDSIPRGTDGRHSQTADRIGAGMWGREHCIHHRDSKRGAPMTESIEKHSSYHLDMLDFWAKSSRGDAAVPMHSVAHHSLDVAAAATMLLEELRPPERIAPQTLVTLVALHDIGKFTRNFQAKVPDLWPPLLGPYAPPLAGYPHDETGYALLAGPLSAQLAPLFAHWQHKAQRWPLLRAITGHHGRPPLEPQQTMLPEGIACGACLSAAGACVDALLRVLAPPPLPRLDDNEQASLAWWLAGLTNLADWIGSGRWFAPVPARAHADLAAYWQSIALPRARQALREAGLKHSALAPHGGLSVLFPHIEKPRPLQVWADSVDLPSGPALFVIEDVTGSGKTEAALVLTHRLMVAGQGQGLFFALPTMATANAMYGRLRDAYARMFATDARPSLVLAHGRRKLDPRFTDSILVPAADSCMADGPDAADQPAGAQCAAWIADDRRKAFLAEIGVGTIDQALLAVLPSRHAMLRLLGLSQRVLVVDEAHAYDAYMGEELKRLLQFQAALGGSAIVLSATLTAAQRAALAAAFWKGLQDEDAPPSPTETAYPLATMVSRKEILAQPVAMAEKLRRCVAIERVTSAETAADAIAEAAAAGAAVAWVRNAVDDTIEACTLLRARGLKPMLFHARFAMGDRLIRENQVLQAFGKDSMPSQRAGRVLVATQVVEQSLDLDFDLMVSDLAPADLLIQRAGRIWRHADRPRPLAAPRLLLLAPEPVAEPPATWLGAALRRTGAVYADHALLWRSARALLSAGEIAVPDNIRALVEEAYDRDKPGAEPPGLNRAAFRAEGRRRAEQGVALLNLLSFEPPYRRDAGAWEPDVHTPTRLGERQTVLRLARIEDGRLVPWCGDGDARLRDWALSEISLRAARVAGPAPDEQVQGLVEAERQSWPRWDQEIPVLVLRRAGTGWEGAVLDQHQNRLAVGYDHAYGMVFLAALPG